LFRGCQRERGDVIGGQRVPRYFAGSDLTNPKAGAFFTALLPQFLVTGGGARLTALVYAAIAAGASLAGLSLYAAAAARLRTVLASRRARRTFDRSTGAVLLALGARLAIDHR
jgi:threonine/homoserine/homoserine lactone efflux protein